MEKRHIKRPLAMGAAAVLGFGGALIAAPGFADDKDLAPTHGVELEAFVKDLAAENDEVVGGGRDVEGNVVVYTLAGSGEPEALDAYENVEVVELKDRLQAYASTDVVGGAGYAITNEAGSMAGVCSVGFPAWSPEGEPAVFTAGHCDTTEGFRNTYLTAPSSDREGADGTLAPQPSDAGPLGPFGFTQFGGPGGSAGENEDPNSIDFAIVDVDNPDLTLHPQVTGWSDEARDADDLASDIATNITGIADPEAGPVAKSGRTTGYSEGTIELEEGWQQVALSPTDARWVHGFGAVDILGAPGDSGGAMFQGETAVGVVSGGGETSDGQQIIWGARLQDALEITAAEHGGYTIQRFLEAPELTSHSEGDEVEVGETISGTAPANTTLNLAYNPEAEIEVGADGTWSYEVEAPSQVPGDYDFTLQAVDGFNESAVTTVNLTVVEASQEPTPTPTPTEDPTTPTPTPTPTEDPTTPTPTPTDDPTEAPVERELAIQPERITAEDFVDAEQGVTIGARGFDEGETVTLEVVAGPESVTGIELTETADENGAAYFSVYGVNASQPEVYIGDYDVEVTGAGDGERGADPLTGSFSVVASDSGDGEGEGGGESELPRTGAELTGLGAGLLLLVAGAATVWMTTRRSTDTKA
ncbi:S1 family peptidase [Sediminivirga luteola]|uniref:S1 family peptidase n=1 Tax=Sediminivirga luteola TaxID=1774748 RepID=UPI001F58CEC4|nr:S1 family peptidase [Sediminivirga luteola]MCI2265730.1 S1 family peptidase [Sediminivirga luteola]